MVITACLPVFGCEPSNSSIPTPVMTAPVVPEFRLKRATADLKPLSVQLQIPTSYPPLRACLDNELLGFSQPFRDQHVCEPGVVSLTAYPDEAVVYQSNDVPQQTRGMVVRIFNRTNQDVNFPAPEHCFSIRQEVLTASNVWKQIEYRVIGCGFSGSDTLTLAANSFAEIPAPSYEGSMQVRARLALYLQPKTGSVMPNIVYSPIFNGSINPGQLIPYNDRHKMDVKNKIQDSD